VIGEKGPGAMSGPRTWPSAVRIEASVTVAIPDSFVDSVRIWPRAAGTTTVRGDFHLPYFAPLAEVRRQGARAFTLLGYLYRVSGDPENTEIPLAADLARFGFTVMGRVRPPA